VVDDDLDLVDLDVSEKLPAIGSSQPMSRFMQRASGGSDKALVIPETASSRSFSDVCTDAVGRSYHLLANRVLGKMVPRSHHRPNRIREIFRQSIHAKVLEI